MQKKRIGLQKYHKNTTKNFWIAVRPICDPKSVEFSHLDFFSEQKSLKYWQFLRWTTEKKEEKWQVSHKKTSKNEAFRAAAHCISSRHALSASGCSHQINPTFFLQRRVLEKRHLVKMDMSKASQEQFSMFMNLLCITVKDMPITEYYTSYILWEEVEFLEGVKDLLVITAILHGCEKKNNLKIDVFSGKSKLWKSRFILLHDTWSRHDKFVKCEKVCVPLKSIFIQEKLWQIDKTAVFKGTHFLEFIRKLVVSRRPAANSRVRIIFEDKLIYFLTSFFSDWTQRAPSRIVDLHYTITSGITLPQIVHWRMTITFAMLTSS